MRKIGQERTVAPATGHPQLLDARQPNLEIQVGTNVGTRHRPQLLATVGVIASLAFFGAACSSRADDQQDSQSMDRMDLTGATVLEVVALDPEPPAPLGSGGVAPSVKAGPLFHGYPYFGRSNAVSSVDSQALVADLNRMIASKPEVAWACELPRHAVRLGTTASEIDVLVSFECGNLEIYDAKGNRLVSRSIEGGDQNLWYAVFQRSGIERQSYP